MNLRREKISQNGEFYRCFALNRVSSIEQKRKSMRSSASRLGVTTMLSGLYYFYLHFV